MVGDRHSGGPSGLLHALQGAGRHVAAGRLACLHAYSARALGARHLRYPARLCGARLVRPHCAPASRQTVELAVHLPDLLHDLRLVAQHRRFGLFRRGDQVPRLFHEGADGSRDCLIGRAHGLHLHPRQRAPCGPRTPRRALARRAAHAPPGRVGAARGLWHARRGRTLHAWGPGSSFPP